MDKYVYYIGNKIYINLTNKCSNDCDFCIRKGRQGMENQPLWLQSEPTADQVVSQFPDNMDDFDSEVVFCGFGEPTYNLEALEDVAAFLHCVDKTVRLNTNGQANLIHNTDVSSIIADSCDIVNISLNAPTREKYAQICHSKYAEKAFDALLEFAKLVKNHGANVVFSVVDTLEKADIDACQKLADDCGIPLRIRNKE